jgi:hypothetical protein
VAAGNDSMAESRPIEDHTLRCALVSSEAQAPDLSYSPCLANSPCICVAAE